MSTMMTAQVWLAGISFYFSAATDERILAKSYIRGGQGKREGRWEAEEWERRKMGGRGKEEHFLLQYSTTNHRNRMFET